MNKILYPVFEVAFYFLNNGYVEHQPANCNASTVVVVVEPCWNLAAPITSRVWEL
jgi:hypothetical protein